MSDAAAHRDAGSADPSSGPVAAAPAAGQSSGAPPSAGDRDDAPAGDTGAHAAGNPFMLPLTPPALVVALSGIATALLLLVMVVVPPPYAIEGPGPTVDALGEVDGTPLIGISGADVYPTEGSLRLTTVSVRGGPNDPVDLIRVVLSWLSPTDGVVPREQVYPQDTSASELEDLLSAQMTSSQESAVVAALTELGYDVPAELLVAATVEGSGSDGVIEAGDVLLSAGSVPLPTFQDLADVLARTPPGTEVDLELDRAGARLSVVVATGDDGSGGSLLGVNIAATYDPPVDVTIAVDGIGGPSAGLVFALGILDRLTPGSMTGGESIAGTGTMTSDGRVGEISGVRKKMAAAVRDGATYFLAPAGNCAEVAGGVPEGLRVVGVATLAEARAAVTAIGDGLTEDLPGCAA